MKGIELCFVIESPEGLKRSSEQLAGLLKNSNFKVRFAKNGIEVCILLFGTGDVFIGASLDPLGDPSYWSDNSCLKALVETYFKTVWQESRDVTCSRVTESP